MAQRRDQRDWDRDATGRRAAERESAVPEYQDHGLQPEQRRLYRGRESYEQQSRGGRGGRSGAFDQHASPHQRDYDAGHRSARELESSYRGRDAYRGPQGHEPGYHGSDEHERYAADSRDYASHEGAGRGGPVDDDYSKSDYGNRSYRGYGQPYSASRASGRYAEGDDYRAYDQERDLGGSPYWTRIASAYDRDLQRGWSRQGHQGYGTQSYRASWGPGESYDGGRYESVSHTPSSQRRPPGRGPKGYKRSDDRIREDICDRLIDSWDIDASEIEVKVESGEVMLSGTIPDRGQKHRVENIADSVSGVVDVHNTLRVKRYLEQAGDTTSQPSANGGTTAQPKNSPPASSTRHS